MRPIRRAAITGLFALWLAPLPALAGSQSCNASSGCDGPRCRHVESFVVEDGNGRHGGVREQVRSEPRAAAPRRDRDQEALG
jgi:hypothetical protein